MAITTVRTINTSSFPRWRKNRRITLRTLRRALRGSRRQMVVSRAPFRTGGWFGTYNRRGRDELKFIDQSADAVPLVSAGGIILLNGIIQGQDYNNRIGRKIINKSLLIRIHIIPVNTVPSPTGDAARFLIVYDSQTNGVSPSPSDIIDSGNYLRGINLNNRERFRIIKDWIVPLSPNAYSGGVLTGGVPTSRMLKAFKRLNLDTIFNGTGATIGSIATGSLILLYDCPLAAGGYQFNMYSRVRYQDS